MSEFQTHRSIKATRKDNVCEQCGRKIEAGSPAEYHSGKYDGYMYTNYTHPECHAAALAYATECGLWGDEWPWFQHMESGDTDHHAWLLEHHPIVAARLNIVCQPVEA